MQPKRKASEIFEERDRIEAELYRTFVVDEVSVARLLKAIKFILNDPYIDILERASLCAEMAHLYSYKRDTAAAIDALAQAETLGFDRVSLALSKSEARYMIGSFSEALSALESIDMSELTPGQVTAAMHQVEITCGYGLFEERYYPSESQREEALKLLESYGANEGDLIARLDSVAKFISAEIDHPLLGYKSFADSDGDCFLYRFAVRKSVPEVAELNRRIIKHRLDHFDDPIDMAITINAMPFSPEMRDDQARTYHVDL